MRGTANDTASLPLLVVVMGISGSGKTTVGERLAEKLGVTYADGDSFHSAAHIAQMASGIPLTDQDRRPWLLAIGSFLREHQTRGAVVSCSALRRAYRDVLTQAAPRTVFLHLSGSAALIRERVARREHHFMPVSLLESQIAALEPLGADERGVKLDVGATPEQLVDAFLRAVASLA
jgi:gluconokinase